MKTYYDGEEREITEIYWWGNGFKDEDYWCVCYTRGGEFNGSLVLTAKDELDAMRKFPAELERQSINHEDT